MELLPDTQTPSWLGLPNNAERVLLTTQGEYPRTPTLPSWSQLLLTQGLWEARQLISATCCVCCNTGSVLG